MGLWEFLQQWRGSRATVGITVSLLLHALVVAAVLWGARLPIAERWRPKPGDALIVELPKADEPASAGSPSAPPGPVTPEAPPNPAKTPPPAPAARPAPPAPRQVAAAPRAPEPSRPAAKPAEPPRPVESPRPAEPARPAAPPSVAEPADTGTEKAARSEQAPTTATPRVERVPPSSRAEPGNPQVASVPPGGAPGAPALPDMRSALRRGAGGRGGEGRGGILGDPIPLDSPDPKFHEFLNQVRKQIQDKLTYPCIKHPGTFECEPKDTEVIVQFGILKTGRLQFVELYIASPWSIYDDTSMNAIRLAQPFPPVPAAIMAALPPGSTGMPITGRFRFHVTYSTLVR